MAKPDVEDVRRNLEAAVRQHMATRTVKITTSDGVEITTKPRQNGRITVLFTDGDETYEFNIAVKKVGQHRRRQQSREVI